MGNGILVCGMNGAGKSTFGKALAARLRYHFIDAEQLYFPLTDQPYLYDNPRTQAQAQAILQQEIAQYGSFVFASVTGDWGEEICPFFQRAILIYVPREIRIQRVKKRSYEKFGARMLPGGDFYEREERFFAFVENRDEKRAEAWARTFTCPVIRLDGTKPIEENVAFVMDKLT